MCRRSALINPLARVSTAVRAAHITRAVSREVVTAKAEQIPKICTVIGLPPMIGLPRVRPGSLIAAGSRP